jgi:hypothetical protein
VTRIHHNGSETGRWRHFEQRWHFLRRGSWLRRLCRVGRRGSHVDHETPPAAIARQVRRLERREPRPEIHGNGGVPLDADVLDQFRRDR